MRLEWDEAKRSANLDKHGIGFGFIRGRLMAVVFTERGPDTIRIISMRKANQREKAHYKKALADQLGKN